MTDMEGIKIYNIPSTVHALARVVSNMSGGVDEAFGGVLLCPRHGTQ